MKTMQERAVVALNRTWDVIGYDVLDPDGRATLGAEEVREAVSSAGFLGGYPEMYGNDKEAVAWLEEQSPAEQDRILALAFPHGSYGF